MYGVSEAELASMDASKCGICGVARGNQDRHRLHLDHDHSTGMFRALLCTSCNIELGKVEADKNKILGLLEYLDKHN